MLEKQVHVLGQYFAITGENNMIYEILKTSDNDDNQEDFEFTGLYLKIALTVIDEYTTNRYLNMQWENLRPMKNIDNNDKKTDEIYQKIWLMTNNQMKDIRKANLMKKKWLKI